MSRAHSGDPPGARPGLRALVERLAAGAPRPYLARLAEQTPINASGTIAVALLIAGFLLAQAAAPGVLIWAAAQLGVAVAMLARRRQRRHRRPRPPETTRSRRGLYRAMVWAAITGSLWGALTVFLPGAPPHAQIVLILTMGGMAAAGSATLAAVPPVAAIYILGCTVPVTGYYLLGDSAADTTLGLVFMVFALAMIATSHVVFSALSKQFSAERYAQRLEEMSAALRESEARLRGTFDNAAVGIAHVGMDGAWLQVNARACEILGYSRAALLAGAAGGLMQGGDTPAEDALLRAVARGERGDCQFEQRCVQRDGRAIWVHLTASLQRGAEGQPLYAIVIIQDVTDRRQAEAALRDSDRAKDEFLAVLGHELRNPLAPLRTGLELLEHAPGSPALRDSLLPMMDRQLTHLVRLVDDLLDISRISRGAIELQRAPLDVTAPIQAAIEQTRALIEQRRHRLRVVPAGAPLQVHGDLERLTQVFANLLGNAVKYTEPGGTICIRSEASDAQAVVRISDTGYGIPPHRIDGLFELFSQVPEHRHSATAGLGIGLALSRRLIEMHGGSIEALSAGLGHGSEFIVRLPTVSVERAAPPAPRDAFQREPPRRVLVVDDNRDAADSLSQLLQMQGHAVEVAYDGGTALRRMASFEPDLVLLDLGLPDIDGLEVARRARALAHGARMLLVAVTGRGLDEDRRRTQAAGFDEHLTKPADCTQLARLLARSPHGRAASPPPAGSGAGAPVPTSTARG